MKVLKMNLPVEFDLSDLNRITLLRDLPHTELRQMSEWLRRKIFAAGTTLMTVDQAGETVYFILDGTVKVHVEQEDGSDVIISILGPGDSVGEMSALDQTVRSASVVTLEESDLLWIDRATFRRFLISAPGLAHNLACILSARLRQSNEQIQSLAALEVENRIARQILVFAERYGQRQPEGGIYVPIRLTQSDIASLVGASREHTNKILVSYKERGYLSVDQNHHITIHNLSMLSNRGQ
ncbi:MAG: Crp/Fnr family transcriptional regulator [Blastocatellales bacterium]